MKKLLLLLTACVLIAACGRTSARKTAAAAATPTEDRVEVLYFHSKQRCATCLAIEKNTREALEARFADELKKRTLVFRSIDITEPENQALAETYEVTWSSLFVTEWRDGRSQSENLTEFAFANARTAPEQFRKGLTDDIAARLR